MSEQEEIYILIESAEDYADYFMELSAEEFFKEEAQMLEEEKDLQARKKGLNIARQYRKGEMHTH